MEVRTGNNSGKEGSILEFTREFFGKPMLFYVMRSLDLDNLFVTHAGTGWKVCDIDSFDAVHCGEENAAKLALERFISTTSEKRFYSVIVRVQEASIVL